jgi:GNAT superfamily N-acetyltransferase
MCDIRLSHALVAGLDSIFFEASATRQFNSAEVQAAFRQRWLGTYLDHRREHGFVALGQDGAPLGYLVGSLDDPAHDPLQAEIGYFRDLASYTRHYPAHLHVNLAPHARSRGLGARLVEAFCAHAGAAGVAGVHVVTGEGMRNVRFYERMGFSQIVRFDWSGRGLLMLGRKLG